MEKRPRKPSEEEEQKEKEEHGSNHSHSSKQHRRRRREHHAQIPVKPTQHFHLPPKATTHSHHPNKEFSPVLWDHYYDEMFFLEDGTSVFRAGNQGAIYFCFHGAGQSAQSFALLAKEVSRFGTLICYDLKGHGYSKRGGNLEDMSIETLVAEATETLKDVLQRFPEQNFVLVGHSLGGSIACRLTDLATNEPWGKRVQGMIIIDVVEGTALQALPFMTNILENRPKIFKSQDAAIQWRQLCGKLSVQSNNLRRVESAKVSIPPQLRDVIINGDEHRFEWKVDLMATEKYWQGWFQGLSACFLRVKVPKIIITAEKERLDKELTIAQMQGRFKLTVIHNVGHSVQEDDYHGTAKVLHDFMFLFRIPQTAAEEAKRELVGLAKFHPELKPYD